MSKSQIAKPKSQIINDLAALVFIAALVLLFFWRIITPRLEDRAVFPPGDFTDQFWMFRVYEARAFAQGRLPLWSDNFNSGHPFLADVQSALFYPISLVWTLLVVATRGADFTLFDLELEAIFHFILAGAFTYLFAKRLLGSRIAALVSALTFTFGGYLTSYPPQQLAILETATWLPLILLLLDYAIERGVRYYLGAGVALGIAALAGHPQTFMFVGYASVIYFVWRITNYELRIANSELQIANGELQIANDNPRITHRRSRITHHASRFAFSLFIAAGLAAAQWLPSIEYQMVSTRATLSWRDAASGFPTLDPLQMILPGYASAFQSPLYIGILPLWLALLALFIQRSREKVFWILLALGALIVSFGFYVFGYALFYLFVPGFALFRGQERLAFIISFSLAMLAGYGLRDLMQASFDGKRARRALRAWALLPAGIVVSLLMLFTMYIASRAYQTGRLFFLTDRAGLMTLLFVLASVVALILIQRRQGAWGFALAFIVFDLFSINNAAYNADPTPRFPATPIIETIQADAGIFRVVDESKLPGHFGIAYALEEIGGISPLRIAHYAALLDNVPPENLWRMLNVRYVITQRPGFANADIVTQDGETRLLRLQNEMPRAWFVALARDHIDDETALAALRDPAFDPQQIAYVADALPFMPVPNGLARVEVVAHTPERMTLALVTPTDQLLMLSENYYYPGWRAFVDGIETKILRANVALSAVPVRANAKHVELIFDPSSVKVGIAMSAITLLAIVVGMFLDR